MVGEAHRALGNEHDVLAFRHHQARELDGVGNIVNGGDGAGCQFTAIHDSRIHLDLAVFIQYRTATGIENRVVFQERGAGFHRLQCGTTQLHDTAAMFEGQANAFEITKGGFVVLDVVERAGSAMHHQGIAAGVAHGLARLLFRIRVLSHIAARLR